MEKFCPSCNETKNTTCFSKNKSRKDGLDWRCKQCVNQYLRERYKNNKTEISEKLKQYKQSDLGKKTTRLWIEENKQKIKQSQRKYNQTEKGKVVRDRHIRKHHEMYPEKNKAHIIVNNAIANGKIKPVGSYICSRCKERQAEHYHHPDYNKPLDVIPVCTPCHIAIHRESNSFRKSAELSRAG